MENVFFKTPERVFAFAFPGVPLDRLSDRRDEDEFIARLRARADARVALIGRDMPVLSREEPKQSTFPLSVVAELGGADFEALLGVEPSGTPVFAARLHDANVLLRDDQSDGFLDRRELILPGRDDLELIDLRSIAVQGLIPPNAVALLGQAKAVIDWHARHRFCSQCGARAASRRPAGVANATSAKRNTFRAPTRSRSCSR